MAPRSPRARPATSRTLKKGRLGASRGRGRKDSRVRRRPGGPTEILRGHARRFRDGLHPRPALDPHHATLMPELLGRTRDALYPEMPQNALQSVPVDHCVPAPDIAALLVRLTGEPAGAAPPIPAAIEAEAFMTQRLPRRARLFTGHPARRPFPPGGGRSVGGGAGFRGGRHSRGARGRVGRPSRTLPRWSGSSGGPARRRSTPRLRKLIEVLPVSG
jgi:hypothetical protein